MFFLSKLEDFSNTYYVDCVNICLALAAGDLWTKKVPAIIVAGAGVKG